MTEEKIREIIRGELRNLIKDDRYIFERLIQISDGKNIQTGRTTGTQLATSADQKIALHGATPSIQQSAISAAPSMSATYVQSEQTAQSARINDLIAVIKNKGLTA